MGSQAGGGYSSSPHSFQTLDDNIHRLARKYPLDDENRFGTKVSEAISVLSTDDPMPVAEEFWRALSKGGVVRQIETKNGPGWIAQYSDGSHVVWRPVTTTTTRTGADQPAIDIDIQTAGRGYPPRYRLHITKGRSG